MKDMLDRINSAFLDCPIKGLRDALLSETLDGFELRIERRLRRKIAREIREFARNHEAIDGGMERAIESCARIAAKAAKGKKK